MELNYQEVKRRLALARILIRHPYIIWLDEPTASIDDEAVMHIILALKKFTYKYHMVTLGNTHDGRIVKEADYSIVFVIILFNLIWRRK